MRGAFWPATRSVAKFALFAVTLAVVIPILRQTAEANDPTLLDKIEQLKHTVTDQQHELSQLIEKTNAQSKEIAALETQLDKPGDQKPTAPKVGDQTTGNQTAVVAASPAKPHKRLASHLAKKPLPPVSPVQAATNAPPLKAAQLQTTAQQPQPAAPQQPVNSLGKNSDTPLPAATSTTAQTAASQSTSTQSNSPLPNHVGEAPANQTKPPEVPILASVGGVLTPYGKVVFEPFMQYTRTSDNNFYFQGVEIIPAFLIGNIAAGRTAKDFLVSGATVRTGVTDRLELEAKIPYVWQQSQFTSTTLNANNVTTTQTTDGSGLGDIELAAHYQINDGREDWPFFIGNMRLKTDTGSNPYNMPYNADGSAARLATGSGFTAIEPSMTAIYPMDPAILFGNIGYIHSFGYDVDRTIAGSNIGNVAPGDTYLASVGVGVALNDRLSMTFGYEQDHVRPTVTTVNGSKQNSSVLEVGSALTGVSLKLNDRTSVNLNIAAGVTPDAPNAQVNLRVPVTFGAF